MSQMDVVFTNLETEYKLQEEINSLKKQVVELKNTVETLQKEKLEKAKYNPDIDCVMVYPHSGHNFLYCEEWQIEQFSSLPFTRTSDNWGIYLDFQSGPAIRTLLLRLGYRFYNDSVNFYHINCPLHTETWVRGLKN